MSNNVSAKCHKGDVSMKEDDYLKPAILKSSCGSKKVSDSVLNESNEVKPFCIDPTNKESAAQQIQNEMEIRRKNWLKNYKTKLDLNDVLEIRNP